VRSSRPPVALVGATASGKSALALEAARTVGSVEIVVVDAMQVYRQMDIGTAKPTARDRAAVPHHCVDLVEPDAEFTVTDYQAVYDTALKEIAGRGSRPLLVAGTGLYLRAAIDGLRPPGRWPSVRAQLEVVSDTAALHARLADIDPVAAARMEPGNRRRIVRALEVCLGSGRPFSSFGPGLSTYESSDVLQVGLRWERRALSRRIEERFLAMMDAGLLQEVAILAERPGGLSRTATQALGYKELLGYLAGACSLDQAVHLAISRTRRYGVRQLRWFQRDPRVRWFEMESDDVSGELVQALA
jgi:tRNA dimethylallyltransferase